MEKLTEQPEDAIYQADDGTRYLILLAPSIKAISGAVLVAGAIAGNIHLSPSQHGKGIYARGIWVVRLTNGKRFERFLPILSLQPWEANELKVGNNLTFKGSNWRIIERVPEFHK